MADVEKQNMAATAPNYSVNGAYQPPPPQYSAVPEISGGAGTSGWQPQTYSGHAAPSQNQVSPHYTINVVSENVPNTQNHQTAPEAVKHLETYMQFSDRSIRMAFVRKVYGILSIQLLVTFGIISLFVFVPEIKVFCVRNWWVLLASSCAFIACIGLAFFIVAIRRKFPYNLIALLVFTIVEATAIATFTAYFSVTEVLMAFACTMIIVISITIFTFQNRWDFTFLPVAVFTGIVFLICFGGLGGIYYGCNWSYRCTVTVLYNGTILYSCYYYSYWYFVSCGFIVLAFSMFLIADTSMMIGGEHKFALSPEEYIFAALNIYLDIMVIFLYLLMIFGGGRR